MQVLYYAQINRILKTAWIYRTGNDYTNILSSGTVSSSNHYLKVDPDSILNAGHNFGNYHVEDTQKIEMNTWYFVAVSYNADNGLMTLYKNGELVDTATIPVANQVLVDTTVLVGSMSTSLNFGWMGTLDEVSLYPRLLSAEQIQLMYTHGNMISPAETEMDQDWKALVTPYTLTKYLDPDTTNTETISTVCILPIPNQETNEGGVFSDLELIPFIETAGDINDLTWEFTSGNSINFTFDLPTKTISAIVPSADWFGIDTCYVKVTNTDTRYDSNAIFYVVNPVNDGPVFSEITDKTIDEGEQFATIRLSDFVTDIDDPNAQLSYTITGNTELSYEVFGTEGDLTVTALDSNWYGSETFTITVRDTALASDSQDVVFTINNVNDAPVVSAIPNQSIAFDGTFISFDLDDYVADIDDADNTLSWSYRGNDSVLISIDGNNEVSLTYESDWTGTENVWFIVSDPGGLKDSTQASYTRNEGAFNSTPIISPIPNQTISEGDDFAIITLDHYVADDHADNEISWSTINEDELTVDITNRIATISVPNSDWYGAETIGFIATDPDLAADTAYVTFTVNNVNDAPVISSIPNQEISYSAFFDIFDLDNYVTDIDNANNELSWVTRGDSALSIDIAADNRTTVSYPPFWTGTEDVWFIVSDLDGDKDSTEVSFTRLAEVNFAPVLSDIPNQIVDEGIAFPILDLNTYVSDNNHHDSTLSFTVSGLVNLTALITNNQMEVSVVDTNWFGSETITLMVEDPLGASDTTTIEFRVNNVNDVPYGINISNDTVREGQPIGTFVAVITSMDFDPADVHEYSLPQGAGNNERYSISNDSLFTYAIFDASVKDKDTIVINVNDGTADVQEAFEIQITEVVSVNEIKSLNITVYPNPIKDEVFVRNAENIHIFSLRIIDNVGRVILFEEIENSRSEVVVNTETLEYGYYMLHIYTNEGETVIRLIKE
jgi:hypothetical protein